MRASGCRIATTASALFVVAALGLYPKALLAAEPQKNAPGAVEDSEHLIIVGVGGAAELELAMARCIPAPT
jgi:hypothetical protein